MVCTCSRVNEIDMFQLIGLVKTLEIVTSMHMAGMGQVVNTITPVNTDNMVNAADTVDVFETTNRVIQL